MECYDDLGNNSLLECMHTRRNFAVRIFPAELAHLESGIRMLFVLPCTSFRLDFAHLPKPLCCLVFGYEAFFCKMGSIREPTDNRYMYKQSHNDAYLTVKSASGIYLNLENGQRILDATGGAAVSSLGHGDARVTTAIAQQLDQVSYCHPGFFKTSIAEQLADFLVDSTDGKMARACITGSGLLL